MKVMLHCLGSLKVPVSPKSCPSPLPRLPREGGRILNTRVPSLLRMEADRGVLSRRYHQPTVPGPIEALRGRNWLGISWHLL